MKFESKLRDGRKLEIGHALESDADEIIAYVNRAGGESDFLTFGAGEFDISAEDERKFIAGLLEGQSDFMLKGMVDGRIVSVCTLLTAKKRERVKHVGEFGISVAASHWGLGIGRRMCEATIAAARQAGIRKINLKVREDNLRAVRLYESMGFQHEGLSPRAYQVESQFFSDRMLGLCVDPAGDKPDG